MQIIPLSQLPAQTFNVVLAGQYCTMTVYWRQERLYLDLSVGGRVICQGAICQNRADVLQSKSPGFAGTLHFFDLEGDRPPRWDGLYTGSGGSPASGALGASGSHGRWVFVYVEAGEELPATLRH